MCVWRVSGLYPSPRFASNFPPLLGLTWAPFPTDRMIGTGSDAIDGGFPPKNLALTGSQLLSMGPMVFAPLSSAGASVPLTYLEGNSFSNFIPVGSATGVPVYPRTLSWGTVGNTGGHRSMMLMDSLFYMGGFSERPGSQNPSPVITQVASRVIRARIGPFCPWVATGGDPSLYFGGTMQLSVSEALAELPGGGGAAPSDVCYKCPPGSRLVNLTTQNGGILWRS
jgi:hypothetical protein